MQNSINQLLSAETACRVISFPKLDLACSVGSVGPSCTLLEYVIPKKSTPGRAGDSSRAQLWILGTGGLRVDAALEQVDGPEAELVADGLQPQAVREVLGLAALQELELA